ncbi:beta-glucosidase BglX [candidate division KSB1 bacterium]|nr:beta-glucosidase BglX [candidate division KSB1 bacterium]
MKTKIRFITFIAIFIFINVPVFSASNNPPTIDQKIDALISQMTIEEKIGQMTQRNGGPGIENAVRRSELGSVLNEVNVNTVNELQRIAVEETRLGIPLIIGRDVIHGFRTLFPIPIGLACTFNRDLIEQGARIAATEAVASGVRWTFAPMMDICHDPRWGRIAETLGEDPYLASELAVAMVRGFQGDDLSKPDAIAACAKHYVGYGAAEGGRDYNTASIPENELRDTYLRPFQASEAAGAATFMTAFNEVNGVPISGNTFLLRDVLRGEWGFQGMIVSDWGSITQMIPHGFCADEKDAAYRAILAGVDMEMASPAYVNHLKDLVESGAVPIALVDDCVRNILRLKFQLGLFDHPYTDPDAFPKPVNEDNLKAARITAQQSIVMLKNDNKTLPLSKAIQNIAVIGPLADDPYEQLGTWSFDKNLDDTQTPLMALRDFLGKKAKIHYVKALETSRSRDKTDFLKAIQAAEKSDVVVLVLGEEAILSGEAHCRANIDLPGAQEQLIDAMAQTGKQIVLVVIAGRPLTMGKILDKVDAILYAFHPGTMGGPALVDLMFGVESPSGKLAVTFPKVVGQIPMYYNHKNTGRPANPASWTYIDDIPVRVFQTSLGNESHYLDAGFLPQYPFGFGMSYTKFEYTDLKLASNKVKNGDAVTVSAIVKNTGDVEADEIVQLYIRDLVGDRTRPVKELKGFQRIRLAPGKSKRVAFDLSTSELAFHNQQMQLVTEPGMFHVWIAGDSQHGLQGEFEVVE